jgi:hypothetical protein
MKEIKFLIPDKKLKMINKMCVENGLTHNIFLRRAIDMVLLTKADVVAIFNDPKVGVTQVVDSSVRAIKFCKPQRSHRGSFRHRKHV